MLCKEFEGGREKCARYWDNNIKMENYTIMLKSEENKDQYIIRDILLRNKNNQERIVKQIYYIGLIMVYQMDEMEKFLIFLVK